MTAVAAASLANPSIEPSGTMPVCIARDGNGIYAMTLTCTQMGFTVAAAMPSTQGPRCPCHQSADDANGSVMGGPAPAPLQHFGVTADASGLPTIHTGQSVSADMRLTGL